MSNCSLEFNRQKSFEEEVTTRPNTADTSEKNKNVDNIRFIYTIACYIRSHFVSRVGLFRARCICVTRKRYVFTPTTFLVSLQLGHGVRSMHCSRSSSSSDISIRSQLHITGSIRSAATAEGDGSGRTSLFMSWPEALRDILQGCCFSGKLSSPRR